jgi:GH25 family lysozyme M1 (1,4-beta-N-acetylmuramidase)
MTVYGLDVSKYQRGLDLASVKRQGFDFVVAKCTEGRGYADSQYPVFMAAAKRNDLLFGAYHFLRSDSPLSVQAANLAAHIRDKTIPVMIDCEPSGSSRPKIAHVNGFASSGKVSGFSGKVDVDAFRGTLTQLKDSRFLKDWTPGPAPKPPTPPAPKPPTPKPPVPVPMPVTHNTVDLTDDAIAKIAAAVALKLGAHG